MKLMLKKWLMRIIVLLFSFFLAYFIDQYYIVGKGTGFLLEIFKL